MTEEFENSAINSDSDEVICDNPENDAQTMDSDDQIYNFSPDDTEEEYEKLIENDLSELKGSFPELSSIKAITDLENPTRYAALRDLGLTPEEAYQATTRRMGKHDNRSHLHSSVPRAASVPGTSMSYKEMESARAIFTGVSDAEIQRLYKKVTR